jgi:signal transduction histidine kinase
MTTLEAIFLVGIVSALCLVVVSFIYAAKLKRINIALITTANFNDDKIEELGEKYHSLTKEIVRMRNKSNTFSQLIERVPFAIWRRNEELEIIYTNDAYMHITGDDETRSAHKVVSLFKGSEKLANRATKKESTQSLRKYIIAKGERKLFEITEIPLEEGTFGFAYDLTEIESLKHELEESEALQGDLLESASSAITIYGADQRLKYYNNRFINVWGLTESFLGTNPTYGEVLERLRDIGRLPEHANFKEFKQSRVDMFTNLIKVHEEIIYLPDGRTFRVIFMPAQKGGLLVTYKDITDVISLERSYNTLMKVQAHTLDNLSEAIAVFGQNGKLQIHNPVYIDMWELDEDLIAGSPHISEILESTKDQYADVSESDDFERTILSLINDRTPATGRLDRNDGVALSWASTPLPDGGLLLTYLDITDSAKVEVSLRAEQLALRDAEKIKNNFLANVSYKLRSPLTSISGFGEMLKAGYFGELAPKQNEYVKGILASASQLSSLVDNILDITSIDAGQMALSVEEFSLYTATQEVPAMMQEYIERYNATFTLDCPEDIGIMLGDRKRIIQILRNIARSAFRFIDEGGDIVVTISQENGTIHIVAKDNGRGIPEDQLLYIFERFNNQTSYGKGETGLGLTVAKSFIELHGGSIEIDSEANVGTTITCDIPKHNNALLQVGDA